MSTELNPIMHAHAMRIHRLRQCPETELTDADLESIAYASSDWWVRRIAKALLAQRRAPSPGRIEDALIAERGAYLAHIADALGAPEDTLWSFLPEVAIGLRARVAELELALEAAQRDAEKAWECADKDINIANAHLERHRERADKAEAALEAAQRPPLGYVVIAHYPGQRPYMPSAVVPPHQSMRKAIAEAAGRGSGSDGKWWYTVAEVREVHP